MNIQKLNVAQSVLGLDARYTVTPVLIKNSYTDYTMFIARFGEEVLDAKPFKCQAIALCEAHAQYNREPA